MGEVRLVDLDVIRRFSLAVRRDTVPAEELLASLDASRAVVLAALEGEPRLTPKRPSRRPAGASEEAKVAAPRPRRRTGEVKA